MNPNRWNEDRVTWNLDTGQYQLYTRRLARMHANAARDASRKARKGFLIAVCCACFSALVAIATIVQAARS